MSSANSLPSFAGDYDASAILIKHQEEQANLRSNSGKAKAMQMAKAKARLSQRLLARDEAAAKLVELEDEVANSPVVDTATAEGEAALVVWQETVAQHRADLVKQLTTLNAGIAAAEVTAATATGIAGVEELMALLEASCA